MTQTPSGWTPTDEAEWIANEIERTCDHPGVICPGCAAAIRIARDRAYAGQQG